MQITGCMDIKPEPSRGDPCKGLSQKTDESGSTIPSAAHLEGGSFFCRRGCKPCPTPPATSLSGRGHRTKSGTHVFRLFLANTLPHHTHRLFDLPAALPQIPQSPHSITKWYSRLRLLLLFRGCCCTTFYGDRHQ